MSMFKLSQAIKAFFKVGVIGFGGGTALIPIVEKEIVDEKKLITKEQFDNDMIIQSVTPGAFPVKMAGTVGLMHSSYGGLTLGIITALFSGIITLILSIVLGIVSDKVLDYIGYISIGVSSFIIVVIFSFISKQTKKTESKSRLATVWILIAFAFVFGGFNKFFILLNTIFNTQILFIFPEFSVPMLLLLGISYSAFTRLSYKKQDIAYQIIAIATVILATLSVIKKPIVDNNLIKIFIYILIVGELLYAIILDFKKNKTKIYKIKLTKPLLAILYGILPIIFLTVLLLFLPIPTKTLFAFLYNGVISVLTTFGGGTAFISIAEGIFVNEQFISSELFWSQVVPVCNSLPGPLMVKMLISMGYNIAFALTNSIIVSSVFAIYGFFIGVCTTISSFFAVSTIYQYFRNVQIFNTITKGIMPLIAGLLIPTILSMLISSISILTSLKIAGYISFLIAIVFICFAKILTKKVSDPYVIMTLGILSLTIFSIVNYYY